MNQGDSFASFREGGVDANPFTQFDLWFQEAVAAKIYLPNAMALATATKEGRPSARFVLLKDFDEQGFVFYTNYESPKARELAENPQASLVFYWAELRRQVRIDGTVSKVSPEESEAYFRSRPPESRLAAWASRQSEVLPRRELLEKRYEELVAEYEGREIPLPPYWGGFRVAPSRIEFWQNSESRLHDRICYTRIVDDRWLIERLSP